MRYLLVLATLASFTLPSTFLQAQEISAPDSELLEARVERVVEEREETLPGIGTEHTYQVLEARLLTGQREGDLVEVQNDYVPLAPGDRFFVLYQDHGGIDERYYLQDVDRRGPLMWLALLFVVAIVALGGWYGVRALISLAASLFVLVYVLMPGLLGGWHPLVASVLVAGAILAGAIFVTHGFNRESLIAYGGTMVAVLVTVLLAAWSVTWTHLSGFSADESVYLNVSTGGQLDLAGLLIGGIIIGVLGVLDDIAITQVAVVRELLANATVKRKEVFLRAMRVGREHVGAVVNTLALAYVGVSLPLVLLMYRSETEASAVLNTEIVATEIVRTIVGSFGIVLAVPLVTYLAVRLLPRGSSERLTATHTHSHET
jgi:uncharacterized membrane protein